MLLVFVIILMVVGLAIVGALYSLFTPFFDQLGDIRQYNMAYYGAISSAERGMLSLRYHGPGFEGQSGYKNNASIGNIHDVRTGLGGLDKNDHEMYRSIQSRAENIPSKGQGNVPYALRGNDSQDYNILGYNGLMEYHLDMDDTTNSQQYYQSGYVTDREADGLMLFARLPQKVYNVYGGISGGLLSANQSAPGNNTDQDRDGVSNDLVMDRSLEGKYKNDFFRIVPRIHADYANGTVLSHDTLIRESYINKTTMDRTATAMWAGTKTPLEISTSAPGQPLSQNMIAPSSVKNAIGSKSFMSIFNDRNNVSNMKLLLGVARKVILPDGKMYPFLETKLQSNKPISDVFYRLDGHARVGDYDVTVAIKKPTSDRSILGSFTIVF